MMNTLNKLVAKLKPWQSFIVIILIIVYMYTDRVERANDRLLKQSESAAIIAELKILNNNVINGSLDRLSHGGASFLYDRTFGTANKNIYRLAEDFIDKNTIDSHYTQETIRDIMFNRISYFYKTDIQRMKEFKYNGVPLSETMEEFSPTEVTNKVCNTMFKDASLPHSKIKYNVRVTIDDIFNDFNIRAVESLSKIN